MRTITSDDVTGRMLSADEKGYLEQRGRHADVELNESLFGREVVAGSGEIEVGSGPAAAPEMPAAEDNYDQWKNQELLDEGGARVPPVDFTGCTKKADYVLALRAWDLEHPDTDKE
jgi:hypothetical protein